MLLFLSPATAVDLSGHFQELFWVLLSSSLISFLRWPDIAENAVTVAVMLLIVFGSIRLIGSTPIPFSHQLGAPSVRCRLRRKQTAMLTEQERSQPNRTALEYWADGLEPVYLEGAFLRAKGRLL
jgi:hypothetical protein